MMFLALVAGLAAPAATGAGSPAARGSHDVAPLVQKAFQNKRHRFCHDPEYPLTPEELAWCPLLASTEKRCPALRRACAAGARAELVGQRQPLRLNLPQLPAGLGVLLWVALIGLGVLLVALLLRQAIAGRRPPADVVRRTGGPGVEPGAVDAAHAAVVETDVQRLLDRARAAAAAGDYRRAVADCYAALLRKLEGTGLIRVEAHRTNGDFLRDLGERQPALRPEVKAVVAEVERAEFGGEAPDDARFRWVHDRVVAMVVGRVLGLALLLGSLAAGGCRPERDQWDDSPSGRAALREILQGNGLRVTERISGLERISADVDTVVLLPDAEMTERDWPALLTWMQAGRTLVVAGRPARPSPWLGIRFDSPPALASQRVIAEPAGKRWYGALDVLVPPGASRLAVQEDEDEDEDEDGEGDRAGEEDGDGWRILLSRGGAPYALDGWYGEGQKAGRVVVFADDRLFCNAALLAAGNARFVTALLAERGERVQFAGLLAGIVAQDPVTAVSRGRLAPALLQLAIAAVLFFLYRGAHFGRPRAESAHARRSFVDHVRALGLVYARARAGRVALEHYGSWATERLAERLHLGGSRRLSAIAEGVAARTGRSVGEVMRLLLEARPDAAAPAGAPEAPEARGRSDAEAMIALRALVAVVTETAAERAPKPPAGRARS
jgi:hypothetical protein